MVERKREPEQGVLLRRLVPFDGHFSFATARPTNYAIVCNCATSRSSAETTGADPSIFSRACVIRWTSAISQQHDNVHLNDVRIHHLFFPTEDHLGAQSSRLNDCAFIEGKDVENPIVLMPPRTLMRSSERAGKLRVTSG
jgi:hypothetical protein